MAPPLPTDDRPATLCIAFPFPRVCFSAMLEAVATHYCSRWSCHNLILRESTISIISTPNVILGAFSHLRNVPSFSLFFFLFSSADSVAIQNASLLLASLLLAASSPKIGLENFDSEASFSFICSFGSLRVTRRPDIPQIEKFKIVYTH